MRWKVTATSLLLGASLLAPLTQTALAAPAPKHVETLTKVFTLLVEQHFTHPDEAELLRGAIEGMLDVVDDPYTEYMGPETYKDLQDTINATYAGIGATLEADGAMLTVAAVIPGSPAERAGLRAGDRIVAVDGVAIDAATVGEGPAMVRGPAGTAVVLLVQRGDATPVLFPITRARIDLPTVTHRELEEGLYYIRLLTFGSRTAGEFKEALAAAEQAGASGLVLDLRGNGGGYVVAALEVADMLLEQGTMLVVPEADGRDLTLKARAGGTDLPAVVLVDEQSASSAEILAGALQKNSRAGLIGRRTYGKGTLQTPEDLPNDGVLKLSIARWELADGSSPDFVGLKPDIAIQNRELVLNAAVQALLPQRQQRLTMPRQPGAGVLNGRDLPSAPGVLERDGQIYLPLRFTLEALGMEVRWNARERTVRFVRGERAYLADVSQGTFAVDGAFSTLEQPFLLIDGRSYLSAPALAEVLGRAVLVEDRAVVIQTP